MRRSMPHPGNNWEWNVVLKNILTQCLPPLASSCPPRYSLNAWAQPVITFTIWTQLAYCFPDISFPVPLNSRSFQKSIPWNMVSLPLGNHLTPYPKLLSQKIAMHPWIIAKNVTYLVKPSLRPIWSILLWVHPLR